MSAMAVILFGHGARDPEWSGPIERVRVAMRANQPELRVELAFLEFMRPSLAEAVASLHADAFRQILIVPMFIAQGGHLKREVPQMVAELRAAYPDIDITLAGVVGEAPGVTAAMAGFALEQLAEMKKAP